MGNFVGATLAVAPAEFYIWANARVAIAGFLHLGNPCGCPCGILYFRCN